MEIHTAIYSIIIIILLTAPRDTKTQDETEAHMIGERVCPIMLFPYS